MCISPNDAVYYCRLTKLILRHLKQMKIFIFITCLLTVMFASVSFSQERITVYEYIENYKGIAIEEMENFRIPASITLAQGILESESGNSRLALEAKNHFGIKCHKEWTGKTFYQDDDELNECFRSYKSPEESYKDHSLFLTTRDRYKLLFDLDITDYKGWAYGLKQAGYATNPRYPEMLIKIIEENGLAELDAVGGQQLAVSGRRSAVSGQQSDNSKTPNSEIPNSTLNPQPSTLHAMGPNDRPIFLTNGVKFILARKGDDFVKIAEEFGIYSWQLYQYNELDRDEDIVPGERVYIEKKKGRGEEAEYVVKAGDDMRSVSQAFGIRLKVLCKLNQKDKFDMLREGEVLKLR